MPGTKQSIAAFFAAIFRALGRGLRFLARCLIVSWGTLASMFKQFELIYVVGSEEDLVGLRTNHRSEESFLYHIQASPETARALFLVYLERINELADNPEWYNLLSNNCTLNIVRYMNRAGREGRVRPSHFFNGLFDAYLFAAGYLDTSLPFNELRERSRITPAANAAANLAAHASQFSEFIRQGLPGNQRLLRSRAAASASEPEPEASEES
jgi:hypothetical protein